MTATRPGSAFSNAWADYWSNGPEQLHSAMTSTQKSGPASECRDQYDMTTDEIKAIEREYGCRVMVADKRPEIEPKTRHVDNMVKAALGRNPGGSVAAIWKMIRFGKQKEAASMQQVEASMLRLTGRTHGAA